MKACVFVDGENLRYALCDLFPSSVKRWEYLPKNANWTGLFDLLVRRAGSPQRLRTYWYVVEAIEYYPYGEWAADEDVAEKTLRAKRYEAIWKNKYADIWHDFPRAQDSNERADKIQRLVARIHDQQWDMARKHQGRRKVEDAIEQTATGIEFRRAGVIRYDYVLETFTGKEKAVDVKLAVDLCYNLRTAYDLAIVIAGDGDYVPAIQAIKDMGKRVVSAIFRTEAGKEYPQTARRLNKVVDDTVTLKASEVLGFMGFEPKNFARCVGDERSAMRPDEAQREDLEDENSGTERDTIKNLFSGHGAPSTTRTKINVKLSADAPHITLASPIIIRELAHKMNKGPSELLEALDNMGVSATIEDKSISKSIAERLCAFFGYRLRV